MPQKEIKPWKIGKERPARNPVLAERTPRRNFFGWEFAPPAAVEPPPRWKEPENALSILDLLESQQKKIQAEKKWKEESDERIRKFEELVQREKAMQKQLSSANLSSRAPIGGTPPSSARADGGLGGYETGRSGMETSRTGQTETARSGRPVREARQELTDIPVSHIRSLQKTCPAVLANYRAQRAQKFIKTIPDPDPRAPHKKPEEHRTSFRPAGMLTRHLSPEEREQQGKGSTKRHHVVAKKPPPFLAPIPRSEEDLIAELKQLTRALENTNEEIERQTLKIALSKKIKTYEKRSTA